MADRIEIAGNTLLGGASNQGKSVQGSTLLFSDIPMGDARFFYAEEELTLSTGATTTTDSVQKLLPAKSLILGVETYVTTAVAGGDIATLGFGDASTATRFGSKTVSANAWASASSGSVWTTHLTTGIANATTGMYQASAASLRITGTAASSYNCTAGKIRVCVWGITFTPPTA